MATGMTPPNASWLGKAADMLYAPLRGLTAYLNVPPNTHRLRNAIGLMVGLWAGRKGMDIVAGETLDGEKIERKDVPLPLKWMHRLAPYDHHSDKVKERWFGVTDRMIPAITGAIGASLGSISFYQKSFMMPVKAMLSAKPKDFLIGHAENEALFHEANAMSVSASGSAVFASASGTATSANPLQYSYTLGALFSMRAKRQGVSEWLDIFNKPAKSLGFIKEGETVKGALLNAHGLEPFRPTALVEKIAEKLAGNPSHDPKNFAESADQLVKTWFRDATADQLKNFKGALLKMREDFLAARSLSPADLPQHPEVEEVLLKTLKEALDPTKIGFEKLLIKSGIDPRTAALGDMGAVSSLARWTGDALKGFGLFGETATKKLENTRDKFIEGVIARHKGDPAFDAFGEHFTRAPIASPHTQKHIALGAAYFGTGAAGLYAASTAKDTDVNSLTHNPTDKDSAKALDVAGSGGAAMEKTADGAADGAPHPKHILHSKKDHGFINGNLLDAAEGVTGLLNDKWGAHRVHCAIGLTAGSWAADKAMEAVTGVSFKGAPVAKKEIWEPLQKLYKMLPFNPNSDLKLDKWKQVLRWGIPGLIGGAAVIQASNIFFEDRYKKVNKAKYLDEMENKASMAQSEPFSYTSAFTSLLGFGTGASMLPLTSYSTHLGSRYGLAAGRKVSLPLVGKWWSNNATLIPYGPAGMINELIKEAVHNKARDPELLETMAIGILKPWYDNVTPEQLEKFVAKLHEVRDRYYQQGGVPEAKKAALTKELDARYHGTALWERLEEVGLDPLKATLANNGFSGQIANTLGAKKHVDAIKKEHDKNYLEFVKQRKQTAPLSTGKPEKYTDRLAAAQPDIIPFADANKHAQQVRQRQETGLTAAHAIPA